MGLLFFRILVNNCSAWSHQCGKTRVSIPFANWAYVHTCGYRGWGGISERRGKQGSLKRNPSEMMTGRYNDAPHT